MTTLTIPRDRLFEDLKPGDRITAVDGRLLLLVQEVLAPRYAGGVDAVSLVNPLGTETEWNLYLDQVDEHVTVERAEPPAVPTARSTGKVTLHEPRSMNLRDKLRYQPASYDALEWGGKARRLLRVTPGYVLVLREAAGTATGLLTVSGSNEERRSTGTTLGFAARYGWAYQVDTNPGVWQLTQAGLDVILAWDAEQPGAG